MLGFSLYLQYSRVKYLESSPQYVPRALVVFRPVSPPVAETHPAEVVLTVEALHVVAASVLLDADVALGAVLGMSGDVVGSLAVVSTLGQPSPDCLAVRGGVVGVGALEAEL